MNFWIQLLIGIAALGLLVLVWATLIERRLFTVVHAPIEILAPGSKEITVLQIGDIHLAPWQKRKIRWLRALANLQPDLVVDTGDNLGHAKAIDPLLFALEPLLKLPGVFVNGSNDYHAPTPRNPFTYLFNPSEVGAGAPLDTARMVSAFEKAGWRNLNNQATTLEVSGIQIGFLGVDDAHENLDSIESLEVQRLQIAEPVKQLFGLTHAPYRRVIDGMLQQGVEVLFAGHTHGGQVCIPSFGALVTNCDLPRQYAKGWSLWSGFGNSLALSVVAGLGNSIFAPVRLACRPEVRLITLRAKQE